MQTTPRSSNVSRGVALSHFPCRCRSLPHRVPLAHTHGWRTQGQTRASSRGLPHILFLQCFVLFSASHAQHDPTRARSLPWLVASSFAAPLSHVVYSVRPVHAWGRTVCRYGACSRFLLRLLTLPRHQRATGFNCTEIASVWHPASKSRRTAGCVHVGIHAIDDISDVSSWELLSCCRPTDCAMCHTRALHALFPPVDVRHRPSSQMVLVLLVRLSVGRGGGGGGGGVPSWVRSTPSWCVCTGMQSATANKLAPGSIACLWMSCSFLSRRTHCVRCGAQLFHS